jgi:hypothetical protein
MTRFAHFTSIRRLAAGLLTLVSIIACESPLEVPAGGPPPAQSPVASIEIKAPTGELAVGQVVPLDVRVLAADQAVLDRPVVWASSDSLVATVSQAGVVTARAAGTARITARNGSIGAEIVITVRQQGAAAPAMVSGLLPASVPAGSPGFGLVIHGTGFQPGAMVAFAGGERQAQVISATEIRVNVSADDIRHPGGIEVRVRNPGQTAGTTAYLIIEYIPSTSTYDLVGLAYSDEALPVLVGAFFEDGDLTRFVEQRVTAGVLRIHQPATGPERWELTLTMVRTNRQGELVREENLVFFGGVEWPAPGGQRALRSDMFPNIVLHTVARHDGDLLLWQTLHPSGDEVHEKVWRYRSR